MTFCPLWLVECPVSDTVVRVSAHSLLSPSAADRWTQCPGSVLACKDLPDTDSEASALGSAKHEAAYYLLMHTNPKQTADSLLGQQWSHGHYAGDIDQAFVDHVNTYLRGVRAAVGDGDTAWYELHLDTSPVLGVPDQSGTADAVICRWERRNLYIGDAKFGFHAVSPVENKQLSIYGAAALKKFDEFNAAFDTVTLAIHQPKVGDLPTEWTVSAAELRATVNGFANTAIKAVRPGAPFVPGETQCKWCKIRGSCTARAVKMTASFPVEEASIAGQRAELLTDEYLATQLNRVDDIESWCRDIRAEALRRATSGQEIPGYKVIEGRRGNRAWGDKTLAELALVDALKDDAYAPRVIVSPAEAEKRLKKAKKPYEDIAWLIEQPAGAPSLARVTEPGAPLARVEFGLEEAQ